MNTMVVSVAAMCHHMARAQARRISSRPRPDVYVDTAAMLSHFTSTVLPGAMVNSSVVLNLPRFEAHALNAG